MCVTKMLMWRCELGSAPSTMEAGKVVDAYGAMPGNTAEQCDGVQAYTQALMRGVETWVEMPKNRWPKAWKGKYKRPVCRLRIALYGHPDSGGLWERHCERMLKRGNFITVDPDLWPSVFWHPTLHLLMVVYVDDFKMSGPKDSLSKGWKLIGEHIDMDTPCPCNRYLGCDHKLSEKVTFPISCHPFAYLFDKSLSDPAAKPAGSAVRTQDYWDNGHPKALVRHHHQARRRLYVPDATVFADQGLSPIRCTEVYFSAPGGEANGEPDQVIWDRTDEPQAGSRLPLWTGQTTFFARDCDPKVIMATVKRDKNAAKKQVRAQGFTFIDQLYSNQPAMTSQVGVVTYDMKPFLQSCVERYKQLAGEKWANLRPVNTPFHEERIARPVQDEEEIKGALQPIASKVLMKVLFAARMARFDLLRAVQGLAARVTQWSKSCDLALHRLMCYINNTLDLRLEGFIGDKLHACRLFLFADADHAGEHDNRSTSGCFLTLVGPNTYFPLTAFSKKQTAIAMSSTESEVVAANLSLRAIGLPSSGLWAFLQSAGGEGTEAKAAIPTTDIITQPDSTGDHWEFYPGRRTLVRVHRKERTQLFNPKDVKETPVPLNRLGSGRMTITLTKGDQVDFRRDSWRAQGDLVPTEEWKGKTFFRVYGPYEADYDIEAHEIREALTDWKMLGLEREGERLVDLIAPDCIGGVFVEDNQATIKILEKGKSPKFRHADKTQRTNLSWLSEQFRRKWFTLVHGPTLMQAADILTKPFVSQDKWTHAVRLLGHRNPAEVRADQDNPEKPKAAPSTGDP